MCMFALTVSTAEPKNIKEAMVDSAWIEAMQEELHQFNRLQVWELVDKPFGKNVIKLNCTTKSISNLSNDSEKRNFLMVHFFGGGKGGRGICAQPDGIGYDPESAERLPSKAKYTLEILKKHRMEKGQSIGTPMATKPKLDADLSGKLVDQTDYHSKIGSLMYLHTITRTYASYPKDSGFELTAFSDADHAGCIDTRKSTSGGIQFLGDKLVSWMSKKQDCTAMSSAEAEYVALSASCAQVMWMRTQLKDYGFNYNKIPLYCDSQSAIAISCNPVQHSRTKHIHTRYHFIKEQVENGIIELYFVRTEYQLADMFTKALPEDRFQYLVRRIGMRCLTPAELEDSYKDGDGDASFQLKSNSLPHAHAQTTKTYYKHQDLRIKKAQVLKTKNSANSAKQDLPLRYQVYQGRLLESFQEDAKLLKSFQEDTKYEHVGHDTRSQGGKDDQD
ncbi:hypothetical protein Tco_0770551 [Tanacetum coccineum]|uniref:Uncharacterized protein n=1 Tax=Tanacetum coccineum TaxID=301880 RepID=A0ABQ4ZCS7_9ASTR